MSYILEGIKEKIPDIGATIVGGSAGYLVAKSKYPNSPYAQSAGGAIGAIGTLTATNKIAENPAGVIGGATIGYVAGSKTTPGSLTGPVIGTIAGGYAGPIALEQTNKYIGSIKDKSKEIAEDVTKKTYIFAASLVAVLAFAYLYKQK